MSHSYIARLVAAGALVLSLGSAVAPHAASAAALPSPAYQGQQVEMPDPPEAEGMTASPQSEAAMISDEPVEGGPGMTGVVGDDQPQGQ